MVIFGVEDNGVVTGVARDQLEEWVMTTCRDKIIPPIIPSFEIVKDVSPGKDVAIVTVPRGYTVYCQRHNNKNNYFIRVGSQSRDPSREELSRLFQQRGMVRAELQPISGSSLEDLDYRRLRDYFERVRQLEVPEDGDRVGWQNLLTIAEFMVEDHVTMAGILLFGKTPHRFLPQAGINSAAFYGLDKDYAFKDQIKMRGPMTPLIDRHGQFVETGLVEQAVAFVRHNTPVTAYLEDGARRVEVPTYPERAVREATVNALIHRDYLLTGTDIELVVYQDRLEIISPGKLPNGVTPEGIRIGVRSNRNQLLKDVMQDYGYLEDMGMGVLRKIVRGMQEHNGTDPGLVEANERFMVRLLAGAQPNNP